MGAVGGILGLAGGVGGTGIQGPQAAAITNPVTAQQLQDAQTGSTGALSAQQNLLTALQGQNGLSNQNQVYNQQQGIVNGTGPNPAQAMLNQQTGANIAAQGALMAGQRGAGSNVGLIARQAAQQGANTQQQAVGQGATMQANQSLNALNQAQNLATTQAGQQIGQTNQNTASQQNQQANLLNAQAAYNNAQVGSQGSINSANAGLAGGAMANTGKAIGGLFNSLGGKAAAAEGGAVGTLPAVPQGPQSAIGKLLMNRNKPAMAQGGAVPALVSPGETYLEPEEVKEVAKGENPLKVGEKIPGKPKYPGNDYRNDTVPKTLKEGGIVIPNKIMQSADPAHESYKFVASVLAKRKAGR